MRHATRPVLGILGGMGPLATAHFYRRVVERTPAGSDQAHLPVVMWADPAVPDRTAALLGEGPSPVPALVEGARWLQRAGVRCIAIPCNTAHAYVEQLSKATGIEVLDMIRAALESAARRTPGLERVGVLATRGTRLTGLYERAGARLGLDVVQVSASVQQEYVDAAIRAVKGGADPAEPERWIATAAESLKDRGAQAAIAACTEIPLVGRAAGRVLPLIDSTDALAEAAVGRLWQPTEAVRTGVRTG
ncbi:aspartate/glutamate racemase family protein [Streptomyces drozdowiczii]|uniref:Amino acid racemase n=1 Tax=Streptomyces drozdowiczii TaxID=202862 RepID=A0ABY6PNH2_9ACTN|nr:amino acid racemase [Streptomyces drozdowiczii]MCX0246782.1 amino acid racemase [Streptomyces drozdowiczii]UZK53758.1 amino acid racemase [Streptomyces drozdowiczii]